MGTVPLIAMILRFLFYAFLLYIAYKLVFDLIIPVYRTTRKIKKGFREMQEQMNQRAGQQQRAEEPVKVKSGSTGNSDDYIEFEEVR